MVEEVEMVEVSGAGGDAGTLHFEDIFSSVEIVGTGTHVGEIIGEVDVQTDFGLLNQHALLELLMVVMVMDGHSGARR